MTFLQWLISARAQARKDLRAAHREERRQRLCGPYTCADDQAIYATYETEQKFMTYDHVLRAYRTFKKQRRGLP
jgi:hypothetical protein